MILKNIVLINFGLYEGVHEIDLAPSEDGSRHITIVTGQNGVGKSTLQEAIQLCLLGSLAIDDRLSEANYERHLLKRAHKPLIPRPLDSGVELTFDFIKSGSVFNYRVIRRWQNASPTNEEIFIWENEKELRDLSKKERNFFLRDLVQPGFSKLMFFDGEKLASLYEEENLSAFIAEGCRSLFGLNFVDLLKGDLNYYTNKLLSQKQLSDNSIELKKLREEVSSIDTELLALQEQKHSIHKDIERAHALIGLKNDELSAQGRFATKKLDKIKSERAKIENENKALRKSLTDLYSSLGPFAFCRTLCLSLRERILEEREIEKWKHAQELLGQKADDLESYLQEPNTSQEFLFDRKKIKKLAHALRQVLLSKPKSFSGDVIHHSLSDADRSKIVGWIDTVTASVHLQLKEQSEKIFQNEERQKFLQKEQSTYSKEDLQAPILNELQELNKLLGAQEARLSSTIRKIDEALSRKGFYGGKLQSLTDRLTEAGDVDHKLQLSNKTKTVLEEYGRRVMKTKLQLLEQKVLSRFNLLCRKDNYFDRLSIDPDTFKVKLYRGEQTFDQNTSSAGERQLFIISLLWGLRELTNIALPLIIDTPMARLDRDHRASFISKFLPAVQPQVIVIGTDMEIVADIFSKLEAFISHQYLLAYDAEQHSTRIAHLTLEPALA